MVQLYDRHWYAVVYEERIELPGLQGLAPNDIVVVKESHALHSAEFKGKVLDMHHHHYQVATAAICMRPKPSICPNCACPSRWLRWFWASSRFRPFVARSMPCLLP